MNIKFIFALLLSCFIVSSAFSGTDDLSSKIEALNKQHAVLEKDTATLMLRLVATRRKLLEDMKENVLGLLRIRW